MSLIAQIRGLEALNRFFDHIYIITLPRNHERFEATARSLEGLDFTPLPGVDGWTIDDATRERVYDEVKGRQVYGRPLSPGELGCTMSHLAAYRDMLDRGYERVLVLEDDVRLRRENLRYVPDLLASLPEDWDVLNLCTYRHDETWRLWLKLNIAYPAMNALGLRRYPLKEIRKEYSRPYRGHLRIAGAHWGGWAYALRRRAAAWLIEQQTPIVTINDHLTRMLYLRDDFRCFITNPSIFANDGDSTSSIWGSEEGRKVWMSQVAP